MSQTAPYDVQIRHHVSIPVRDGTELSANLFLPTPRQAGETFPAILEMIPYRKDDWRYNTDHSRMGYLARHGFAGCRLDVRGTGSSPGIALDEYTRIETQDGYDAVEWLASQPWCNGRIGMWGISYGGFTSIQVAKMGPPHLRAIAPMYATDDRYTDDVHYVGGCKTASELAQYAVSQIAMNALPPAVATAGADWADRWRERLAQTPPWLLHWMAHQADGPYWRRGSLAPEYDQIRCAIFHISGWMDGYTNAALRMQARCTGAPRKVLIGNWVHDLPDVAYPGPNIDWLHEMMRFFGYWLREEQNGVMDEPPVTLFRREYTAPEAFPAVMNGSWISASDFPVPGAVDRSLWLGPGRLLDALPAAGIDQYPHRPTLGTAAALCWGAGAPPTGLARDLRPDEALSLTYTSDPLTAPLDIVGFPVARLFLSATAPVAHVVVRLADVARDGTSALVTTGILNLTHRNGHGSPEALTSGVVYPVQVEMKGTAYRFLPGHRLRLSVASAYWPVIFPAPYAAVNSLHRGGDTPSCLVLPVIPAGASLPATPPLKQSPPALAPVGRGWDEPSQWRIEEDVMAGSVTVRLYGGGAAELPDGTTLASSEAITMTASQREPAHARLSNDVTYRLRQHGYEIEVQAGGTIRAETAAFHVNVALEVTLDGRAFWQKSWLESFPRRLL